MIWTIAKKELRGYFNSAIAVIFLAAFVAVTLVAVFWYEKFFARGLADLRPLFEWMPKLLIILVSALAMRLWSEERNAGTLEVLLTLPIPRWKLVVGKFVAGMLLIAIALATTLGIPITVAMMGDLDWGPVIGGYFATLLLAAAYLVIGMCISALTDIQIVAFVGTAAACLTTYVLGWFGPLGRALGTGARFESVARGVIDLRDLAYYASIVAIGIVLNVLLLGRMSWGRGERARRRRGSLLLTLGLIAANSVALGIWLAPVRCARIDITQDGAYSLSSTTRDILGKLDQRLLIRGYFSKKTHPLLEPLIPQIEDMLEEYRLVGGGNVKVEMIDPTDDDEARREAQERFDIKPDTLPFATETEKTVVSAYFAIAIQYGNKHEVLRLGDLIQERSVDINKTEVTLKNPEYEITKSIKKTVTSFASIDAMFAQMAGKAKLTAYVTPKFLPEQWKDGHTKLKTVVDQINKDTGGKIDYVLDEVPVNKPDEPPTPKMIELLKTYGLQPFGFLGAQNYYFHLILQVGERTPVLLVPSENRLDEAAIKNMLMEGIKRAAPGFTHVVGMWTPPPGPPMNMGGQFQQGSPPPQQFRKLREALEGTYEIRDLPLTTRVPDDVEVLLVCGPANLDAKAVEAIDQFVMRGGSLVLLSGRFRLSTTGDPGLEKVTTGLETMLASWGITQVDQVQMDTRADEVPLPRKKVVRGETLEEVVQTKFPFFVRIEGKRVGSSVITGGIPGAVMHFASPIEAKDKVGEDAHAVDVLLRSSDESWLTMSASIEPDFDQYESGFPPPTDPKSQPLAVSVVGAFTSSVKKPSAPPGGGGEPPRLLEHSPPNTRIVVFGSSAFASDALYRLSVQFNWDLALSNYLLVQSAIDWAVADTELLTIRARTASSHALTVEPDGREKWRIINVVIAIALLGGVMLVVFLRKRAIEPIVVAERRDA